MASAELSKLCICIVTLLSLAVHAMPSQQSQQSQPTITNDAMPTDEQLIPLAASSSSPSPSPYPENPAPESGGYVVSLPEPDSYNPPPPPRQEPYIEALSPETQDDQLLSPDYSPSPAPYFQEYLGSDQITDYPSPPPPPYIEFEPPEGYYETYSPAQAPAPAHSSKLGSNVLPFNYKADDESEFDAQDFEDSDDLDDSDQSKNRGTMVGFVLGAVCLVGLAGFMYKKKEKKYSKAKSEYEYELTKR